MKGVANRKLSEKYGLKVKLCRFCHTESREAVHRNRATDLKLIRIAQIKFEQKYSHELWMELFKRNYL